MAASLEAVGRRQHVLPQGSSAATSTCRGREEDTAPGEWWGQRAQGILLPSKWHALLLAVFEAPRCEFPNFIPSYFYNPLGMKMTDLDAL